MLEFSVNNIFIDPEELKDESYWPDRVESDFSIIHNRNEVFSSPYWPAVEFAHALHRWRTHGKQPKADFDFESIHDDAIGLVWIHKVTGGWQVGSVWQDDPITSVCSYDEITTAIDQYINRVIESIQTKYDVDASKHVSRSDYGVLIAVAACVKEVMSSLLHQISIISGGLFRRK